MPDTTLKLQFRSKAPDENLTLQDFADLARDFQAALSALDQHIFAHCKATVAFPVVGLKHSSPSEITIDAIGLEDSLEDNSARIIPAFVTTIESLNACSPAVSAPSRTSLGRFQISSPTIGSPPCWSTRH